MATDGGGLVNTSPTQYQDKGYPTPAAKKEGSVDDGNTGKSEEEIIHDVWKAFEENKSYKYSQVNPADWKRYAMIYDGQHWNGMQKEWQATPTIPLSTAAVNSLLPVITDNRPQIAVVPRQPENDTISEVIRAVIEWLWEQNDCDVKLPATMLNTLIFGNGFWKVIWDPTLNKGVGDIRIINVDPACVFMNPEATDISDATRIQHVEQMSLTRIRMLWPDKGDEVTQSVKENSVVVNRPQVAQKPGGVRAQYSVPTTTNSDVWVYPTPFAAKDAPQTKDTATICEDWVLDTESSRWVKTVVANDVLLEGPEETDFDMVPIVHFVDYKRPWSVWGAGEIQLVENLQYEINKRRGMVVDILRFAASPMLVYDPGAGTDLENVEVEPGRTIPAEGGPQAVGWMEPKMDLEGLFQLNDRDKKDMNDILGNVEMVQGSHPPGVEAGIALEQLADAANTRLRIKIRLMEASLRRCGKILIKFIQKHYTAMRIFRVVGQEANQFFAINKPSGSEPMVGPDGQPTMQPQYNDQSNHIPPDAEFDVRIGAGSTLPVSKSAKFQQAITLFDRHALPVRELLRAADWQNWEAIAQEMEQKAQAAAQMQQGPPQGPPSAQMMASIPQQVPGMGGGPPGPMSRR